MNTSFWCEICGASTMASSHRCKESVLRAIDAANTRIGNQEFETTIREPLHRTEGRRMAEGFFMLGMDDN